MDSHKKIKVDTDGSPPHSFDIATLASCTYRELQVMAKSCGVPSNLKKDMLKYVIRAKMNNNLEEVEAILEEVYEARLLRKKQRAKVLEKKKYLKVESVKEENSNGTKTKDPQETTRCTSLKELLKSMTKLKGTRKVTIHQTSTHTRLRTVVAPAGGIGAWRVKKCINGLVSSSARSDQIVDNPEPTAGGSQVDQNSYGEVENASNTSALVATADASEWPITGQSTYMPTTAISVREALLQQYQRDPAFYNPMGNRSMSGGGVIRQRTDVNAVSFQPYKNYHNQPYNDHLYNNPISNSIQPYNHGNQLLSGDHLYNPQSSGLVRPKPMIPYHYHASQQIRRSPYESFQYAVPGSSTPTLRMSGFTEEGGRMNSTVFSSAVEAYTGPQAEYASCTTVPMHSVPNQNEPPSFVSITDRSSPTVINVTSLSADSQTEVADGSHSADSQMESSLGMLASTAMTKAQESVNGHYDQRIDTGLLMIDEVNFNNNRLLMKNEMTTSDSKHLPNNIPTWTNFLEQMSSSQSPSVSFRSAVMKCKFGCYFVSYTRDQQLDHEEHCDHQPAVCPLYGCTFVGQLRSLTTHVLNVHNNDITCTGNGAYFIDFTDGQCSFVHAHSALKKCPKKFCFPQYVDGRLFFINVVGNFDSMQVVVYVQHVNDYCYMSSHIALEVLRQDGVPYQFHGPVMPLTYKTVNIITRRKCLVFSMNKEDFTQNMFVLHTKIISVKK